MGTYPGQFNKLFPVKNLLGQTTHLVVVSSGYLMVFEVDMVARPDGETVAHATGTYSIPPKRESD